MTTEARGRRGVGNDFSLILETTINDKTVEAMATVLFRKKHAPNPPQSVIFSVAGYDYPAATTDEFGRLTVEHKFPGPGRYQLTAFLVDEPGVRKTQFISISEPEKKADKKAERISVRVTGKSGEQKLFVYAIASDGTLVPGAKAILMIGQTVTPIVTDENGMYSYQTNHDEDVVARVRIGENDHGENGNRDRSWKSVLSGRRS